MMRRVILSLLIVPMLAVSVGCSKQLAATSSGTTPPTGTPSGTPPTGAAPGASSSGTNTTTSTATNISGAFALSSGTKSMTGQSYSATAADKSAIYVTRGPAS